MPKLSQLLSYFLPHFCLICKERLYQKEPVCDACLLHFRPVGKLCISCATPISRDAEEPCIACETILPLIDKIYVHYAFEEPLSSLLRNFKYRHALYLAPLFSNILLVTNPLLS